MAKFFTDITNEEPHISLSSVNDLEEITGAEEQHSSNIRDWPCRCLVMPQLMANIVMWFMAVVVIVLCYLLVAEVQKSDQPSFLQLSDSSSGNQQISPELMMLQAQVRALEKENTELEVILSPDHNQTRALWTIQSYCYIKDANNDRECRPCKEGWQHHRGFCYQVVQAQGADMKTFDEAVAACEEQHSVLAMLPFAEDWNFICSKSVPVEGSEGYWVGLRHNGADWRWINGSELNYYELVFQYLPYKDFLCAMSKSNNCKGFGPMNCTVKEKWICQTKSLIL